MELINPFIINPIKFENDEIFLPITCYKINSGRYLACSKGFIRDLKTHTDIYGSEINSGYLTVGLEIYDGSYKRFLIHRIISETFINHYDQSKNQVNHINADKHKNNYCNLEWMTPKENTSAANINGLMCHGDTSHLSKITSEEAEQICKYLSEGKRYKEIVALMGYEISDNNLDLIGNIKRGISWKDISSKYIFPEYDQRFRKISKENVEQICRYLEIGFDIKDIYEKMNDDKYIGCRNPTNRPFYELISRIKNRIIFKDISSKYNF